MKIKWLLCVVLAACTFGFAKEKADVRDVTGCLSKGDSAKEFLLTGNRWKHLGSAEQQSRSRRTCGSYGDGDWRRVQCDRA